MKKKELHNINISLDQCHKGLKIGHVLGLNICCLHGEFDGSRSRRSVDLTSVSSGTLENTNRHVSVWKCLWDLNRCITRFTIMHRGKGIVHLLGKYAYFVSCFCTDWTNKIKRVYFRVLYKFTFRLLTVWNMDGSSRSEKWSQRRKTSLILLTSRGQYIWLQKAYEKIILLLTWYTTSVNRLQNNLWSQSLLSSLQSYSMMFIF